ncbi:response regulator [Desulfosarcina ovata]|uniref:Response regulatory domain-containing protein n=1 Tax=Desulfosarcina ovata subsp. ovata TaxID=2752305 RepID=A0A5K8AIK2_9BACT|nr:response regulator [Desulfosarcina ovata]BBO91584.1 hypothetical protein DSCOOX_47640 [Desulfosarcina ovata subsp. ovata]
MTDDCILIVENELILAEDLSLTLKELGYEKYQITSTGEDAIAKVTHEKIGFVLMDIKLDGQIDGIEAAKQIQSFSDIPIVYLTAFSNEDLLTRAKETMPYGYLLKPFRSKELKAVIETARYKFEMEQRFKIKFKAMESLARKRKGADEIVTICCHCKKIKDPDGTWEYLESYIESHAIGKCSHSICPICAHGLYPEYYRDE